MVLFAATLIVKIVSEKNYYPLQAQQHSTPILYTQWVYRGTAFTYVCGGGSYIDAKFLRSKAVLLPLLDDDTLNLSIPFGIIQTILGSGFWPPETLPGAQF